MKMILATCAVAVALALCVPATAQAAPATGMTAEDAKTTQALIDKANALPVKADPKGSGTKAGTTSASGATLGSASPMSAYGSYPTRKGVIMVTSDAYKGLIPTGHAAIIYTSTTVVEALSDGVKKGSNNWNSSKSQAYGVTVKSTTATQDSTASNWANGKIGKPYNWNYLDTGTRAKFYCSQLVWAAFKDNFGVDLNTSAYLGAIHPMEFVDNAKTTLLYRKK